MDDSTDPAGRDKVRDGINRENHAIRRSLRALAEDGKQLERRMDDFTGTQRRTRAAIDAAWRAEHPLGGRQVRVSWRTLGPGADVVAADGVRVGAVQEVVADEAPTSSTAWSSTSGSARAGCATSSRGRSR